MADPVSIMAGVGALANTVSGILDELITNDEERAEAKRKLMELQQRGQLEMYNAQLSAILAEAKSTDPWTSRARPTFLYLIYLVIAALVFVGAPLSVFYPTEVQLAAGNLSMLLNAVPESLWWLFGAGYLGYTGGRSFDKWKQSKAETITWSGPRVTPRG